MSAKRILVLEDEPVVAEMLVLALENEGYAVDVAATVAEGRIRLGADGYSLVIADLRLPDGDGLVVADQAANQGTKTLILSGHLSELPKGAAARHEIRMKPMRPHEVIWEVKRSIGSPLDRLSDSIPVVKVLGVTEYDSFISFEVELSGKKLIVQYRHGHVLKNSERTWHLAEKAEPLHVISIRNPPHVEHQVSEELLKSIQKLAQTAS